MVNYHPTKRLTDPDGHPAEIDIQLVPLIEALWAAGYETITCCQNLGESLRHIERKSDYWRGYVLLEFPIDDALRLVDFVKGTKRFDRYMHWAAPGAWEMSVPLIAGYQSDDPPMIMDCVQIRFPCDQLDDLVKVIRGPA